MVRNVVLICLDTVRKDYFDEYAPRLQAAADASLDQCRAASSWTVPSHASMFTGDLPHRHGIHCANVDFSTLDREDTFLGDLPDHRTIGVSANSYADSAFGFDEPFDEFHDVTPSVVYPEGLYLREFESDRAGLRQYADYVQQAVTHDHTLKSLVNGFSHVVRSHRPGFLPERGDDGARTVSKTARRAVDRSDEPYFLFCNYMDAHAPFYPTTRYDGELHAAPRGWSSDEIDIWEYNAGRTEQYADDIGHYRDLYGAAIDYLDREVIDLIDALERRSERETTYVITADHGENLGFPEENELIEHKGSLTEALLHVPFVVVNSPSAYDADGGYFSQLNLGRTIADLARGRFDPSFERSVPAELVGLGGNTAGLDETAAEYWNRMIRSVYVDGLKHQWDSLGNRTSYRLDWDTPCAQYDTGSGVDRPDSVTAFFDVDIESYKSSVASADATDPIDGSVADRLEDLGYL